MLSGSYKFIEVDKESLILRDYISRELNNSKHFRYFKNREISCVDNHIITLLLIIDNEVIGYGHIDFETDYWLGIAISSNKLSKGYGSIMLEELIKRAIEFSIPTLSLSVDKNNEIAIKLYKKYGFIISEEKPDHLILKK